MRILIPALALPLLAAGQPVIRVTTRLVDVSVIARDSKGPVAGLTKEDFKVFDNGVERPIAFFSVSSARPAAAEEAAPRVTPNVFTNRAEERGDAPARLTVFVIDALNTEFATQARVRQQFLKYLRRLGPRDRAAIWVMNDRLRRLQDFTGDPRLLAAAVERAKPKVWLTPETRPAIAGPSAVAAGAQTAEEMMQYYRMQLTNDMLKDLGESLARIPGRKNMVWLSSAFPVNMSIGPGGPETSYVEGRLSGTGRALAKGNVALYPVDARGLVAPQGGQSALRVSIAEQARHESMKVIAAATGGRAFYNTNDLGGAIAEAVDDAEVIYTIGFYPDGSADGDERRLRIETRRPGATLRYRQTYVASAPPESTRRDEIQNALVSPLDATGVPLSVRLEPDDPKEPGWLQMSIVIPLTGVSGELDVIVSQRTADGRELAMVGEQTKLTDDAPLRRKVRVAPGAARIRIVVYERESGRVGSVDLPAKRS